MKLVSVKLHNFRAYKDIKIDLSESLHMLVGMNDIGKSTILEALEIFFNESNSQIKISQTDLHIRHAEGDSKIIISCEFIVDDNERVVVDTDREVSLGDEYLLNTNGLLEISRTWDASLVKMSCKGEIVCSVPNCIDLNIVSMKITDLKKKYEQVCPNGTANKAVKAEMRQGIYRQLIENNPNVQCVIQSVDIKSALGDTEFFSNLGKFIPDYYLFKADRKNDTTDDEVQDPLKIAVKNALSDAAVQTKLKEIAEIVKDKLNEVNIATIEQMQKFSNRLGASLTPKITTNWDKAISNDILDANEIAINKKGSGIRRLLLLSFLMVQAQKRSFENNKKDIIYAIEEPETSLHPKLQKRFLQELIAMAYRGDYTTGDEVPDNIGELNNYKILITTHLPNYIAYATQNQVIYLTESTENNIVEIHGDEEYQRIQDELGLLPNPHYGFVIFVEGDNDVHFLTNLNKVPELRAIFDLEAEDVDIIPLQGSRLLKSIEKDFYESLPVKQFHLYDNDRQDYVDFLNNNILAANNPKWTGVVTHRRNMEYYVPSSLIEISLGISLSQYLARYNNADFDLVDTIHNMTSTKLSQIKRQNDAEKEKKSIKAHMNKTSMRDCSKELLEAHGVYEEVKGWFEKMRALREVRDE